MISDQEKSIVVAGFVGAIMALEHALKGAPEDFSTLGLPVEAEDLRHLRAVCEVVSADLAATARRLAGVE